MTIINCMDETIQVPQYATKGSSGVDLRCSHDFEISPNEIKLINTGISLDLPLYLEGQVRSRSGLSLRGICVINSPGTIDSDYKGEIKVILINHGKEIFYGKKNDRIAQLVFNRVCILTEYMKDSYNQNRENDGFGSTGLV